MKFEQIEEGKPRDILYSISIDNPAFTHCGVDEHRMATTWLMFRMVMAVLDLQLGLESRNGSVHSLIMTSLVLGSFATSTEGVTFFLFSAPMIA